MVGTGFAKGVVVVVVVKFGWGTAVAGKLWDFSGASAAEIQGANTTHASVRLTVAFFKPCTIRR